MRDCRSWPSRRPRKPTSSRTSPPSRVIPEFTPKAIIIGAVFGIIFGAATVYLALKAGLTVSASIPIAVLAISLLKKLGGSTILENNIVQTIGSAGESIAAGVVFTLPGFLFLAVDPATGASVGRALLLLLDHLHPGAAGRRARHPDDGARCAAR